MSSRDRLLPPLGDDPERTYRQGIMGGTFDPIHYGHLVTAEQAREALDLDLVLFMPAGSPAFKQDKHVSDPEDRYAMTRQGIMGGTFDPIHYGHLVTAEQAREALDLDLVLFMPAGSPAFKQDKHVSDPEDRYAMTVTST